MDFSMDFFDRGPPPPHYLAWWKPPSSYFPPRGEAPPPYEEAIASTSNCLPSTFTAMYNNSLDPTDPSQAVINSAEFQNARSSEERNGVTMATTCLTTGGGAHGEDAVQTGQTIVETDQTNSSSAEPQGGAASTSTTSSARTSTTSGIFSGRSNTSLNKPKRYHSVGNTCVIRNETEHLRRNPLPMVTSNNNGGGSTSTTSVLLPYPPPYDYGDPFLLRHSATLPRHRPELHRFGPEQADRLQQRLSLQLNVADISGGGTVAGCGWSSSASSSTLSLSTPDSLHGGRPPSLSSSSSSNVSSANN
jgi:hypothetical protein